MKQRKLKLLSPALILLTAGLTALLSFLCLKGTAVTGTRMILWIVLSALAGGIGSWLCLFSYAKGFSARRLLLLLFVPLSMMMMLAMPVGRVPDEDSHLQRIWLLSEGQWFPSESSPLTEPSGLMDGISDTDTTHTMLAAMAGDQISTERVESTAGFNTGIYPPVSYVPQALAVAAARLFTSNRLALLYAARIGAWLATILLLYAALSLLPRGKYGFIAVCLMPICLQEGMSASVDGMALGAVSLLCAWVLRHRMNGTRLTGRHVLQLTLLCLLTVACKMIYAPFILMALAIPGKQWRCKGGKAAAVACAWGVTLILSLGWLFLCYRSFVSGQAMTEGASGVGTILPQLQYMLSHLPAFLLTILRTAAAWIYSWLHTMLGSGLSALNITLSLPVLAAEGLGLLLVWLSDDALPAHGVKSARWLMPVCGVLSVLVMLCGLYAWWNPYQAEIIEGLQGRYLIPLLMPALLGIRFRKDDHLFGLPAGKYAPMLLSLCLPAAVSAIVRVWACCL